MPLLATVVLMQIRPADASRLYADQRGICPRRYRDVAHVDLMDTALNGSQHLCPPALLMYSQASRVMADQLRQRS